MGKYLLLLSECTFKITFSTNKNLASCYCDESLCERRIVSPKRNISKHVNHMRYNKNLASRYSDIINRKYLNKIVPSNYFNTYA